MTSYAERIAKSKETAERKIRDCENEFGIKVHAFVKILTGKAPYRGRIGRVMTYNDLRDEAHPNIRPEVGVVFSAGRQAHIWFDPKELEVTHEPANWRKSEA